MKVEYRQGNDWAQLLVEDKVVLEGHSIHVADVITAVGVVVECPKGDFCAGCSTWIPGEGLQHTLRWAEGKVCDRCFEYELNNQLP